LGLLGRAQTIVDSVKQALRAITISNMDSTTNPAAPRRRWFGFSLRTMFVGLTLVCSCFGVWLAWDYIPGTVRRAPNGLPRGTGPLRYDYPNGSIMAEEYYRNGLPIRATYYRPDGSVLVTSEFDRRSGGDWFLLHDDGTIKKKYHCKYVSDELGQYYVADGPCVIYKPGGSIDREIVYRDGQEVKQRCR
jgi:hypothetical protein